MFKYIQEYVINYWVCINFIVSTASIHCLNPVGYSTVPYSCVRVLLFSHHESWENDGILLHLFIIFRTTSSPSFVNLTWFFLSNVKLYNGDDGMHCTMVGNIHIHVPKSFWCLLGTVIIKISTIICYCLYTSICHYNALNFTYHLKLYRNDSSLTLSENPDTM